ncbi:hypothetical protein cgR_6039 [Corynebacterium glutamicum R]|uniref:Secreted protein n=1 Tax=Corynebacterium glutamicum (strain R) TaxID=340322 RepID=A0AB72VF87_CORGB|nr:hypothetical protein cgR_6039 [Corynebacterium glutamicum R]
MRYVVILFSAHAEVFPSFVSRRPVGVALLRTRGGISTDVDFRDEELASSPHTRRYFPGHTVPSSRIMLFSAHAEVFPTKSRENQVH